MKKFTTKTFNYFMKKLKFTITIDWLFDDQISVGKSLWHQFTKSSINFYFFWKNNYFFTFFEKKSIDRNEGKLTGGHLIKIWDNCSSPVVTSIKMKFISFWLYVLYVFVFMSLFTLCVFVYSTFVPLCFHAFMYSTFVSLCFHVFMFVSLRLYVFYLPM